MCRMRGGNQLKPLLGTFGRLCLNVSPCSTSQEVLSAASVQIEESVRREIHTTSLPQSETVQKRNSGFGASESKIRAAYSSHLLNSASSRDFVRGSSARLSTLTEDIPASPPDAQGICLVPLFNFICSGIKKTTSLPQCKARS